MPVVLLAAVVLVAILVGHRKLGQALDAIVPRQRPRERWPDLTVVRPIKALDPGARENLESLFTLDYPAHVQVLFVLDDEQDPAWPLTNEIAVRRRAEGHDVDLLLAGAPPEGRTGKLHAMITGLAHAHGELVAFNDSDTRVTSEQVREVVDTLLAHPTAGDAFSPVVVHWDTAQPTAGDVAFALLLNGWYGPSAALAAGAASDLPFIMGQFMVFRRDTFDAIGGLACADGQLVDDMWIGQQVALKSMRNVQSATPLPIITAALSPPGFVRTFRRWLLFSRSGLPTSFTRPHWLRGALYGASLVLSAMSVLGGNGSGLVLSLGAMAGFVVSQMQLHRKMGGQPIAWRHLWVPAVLPLVGGAVMLSALFSKRVDWRGRIYQLDARARLGVAAKAAR